MRGHEACCELTTEDYLNQASRLSKIESRSQFSAGVLTALCSLNVPRVRPAGLWGMSKVKGGCSLM